MNPPDDFTDTTPMWVNDTPPASAGWTPVRMAIMAALVVVALWLGWKSWTVNITMSCWRDEWPQLAVCDEINGRTPQERAQRLQERLAGNPGDTVALVELAVLASGPDAPAGLDARALLARAQKVAPQQGAVLRLQVHYALADRRWVDAVEPLTRLSRYHDDEQAARTLAEMIRAAGTDQAIAGALMAAAKADTGWLDRVLRTFPAAKVPTVAAMPLINELVTQNALTPKLGLALVRQLKAENQWMEAYAIWLRLWNRPLPLLFNGNFDQAFVGGGFDWEVYGPNDHRAGAHVSQAGRKGKGQVLRVELSGKQMNLPIVRQYLMLPPGRYRFSGQQQSTDLRSAQGLAWVFSCASDGKELARVASLKATGRDWKPMETMVEVPGNCGFGVALSLVPQAEYEARAGMRGEMVFDDFELVSAKALP